MADCNSQCVSGVVWAWHLLKAQPLLHQPLHLGFRGSSEAGYRLFDLRRRIRFNVTLGVRRCQFHNTLHLTDSERAAHIFTEEDILKHDGINSEFRNEARDFIVNLFQARFGRCLRARPNVPVIVRGGTVRLRFYHAVSRIRNARVDTKNNQRFCVAMRQLGGGLQ